MLRVQRIGATCAAAVLAGALLAGCSGEGDGDDISSSAAPSTSATASDTATPEPTLPVPAGVELTPQGSTLEVGQTATVAYEIQQGVVGVLEITVDRLEKTSIKKSFEGWDLDDGQRASAPYFVRATVTNVGDTDLSGLRVPLYVVNGDNVLLESTSFASDFTACEPGTFPKRFPNGKRTRVCLVFLAPAKGDLSAVSFRPTQESDPIVWTGELQKPKKAKPPKKGQGDAADQSGAADGAEDPTATATP